MSNNSKIVLIDSQTVSIIHTRTEEIKKKIRKAVIKDNTLYDGAPPFPCFDNEKNKNCFLDNVAALIAQFMTERLSFDNLRAELKEDVESDVQKRIKDIAHVQFLHRQLSLPPLSEKAIQQSIEKVKKCLDAKSGRLPEPLMSLCNPQSEGWRKEENNLVSKMLPLYKKYTPLKKQRRIYENMAMIFIACGLRQDVDSDSLSETLRKRRIKQAKAL